MIRTRFAPSPNGLLHLGHAYAAITAAQSGDRLALRIEDIDTARLRQEFVDSIIEDLHWLELSWETPVRRQSERRQVYREALDRLAAEDFTYPCFCTRREIASEIARSSEAPHSVAEGVYPRTCLQLNAAQRADRIAAGTSYALRLDAERVAKRFGSLAFREHGETFPVIPGVFGDVVVARKGLEAAYHLAVVVDDTEQGVTLVTRGEDLLPATHVQRLLQAALDLPIPDYAHHKLILDADGHKFSKRDHAITLKSLRERGVTVEDIHHMCGLPHR